MSEIVDFSKAQPSRNFRNTYIAKYDRITECTKKQRSEFVSYHDQLEVVRKERAAIIEDVAKKLKELDIKPEKSLGKYTNEELMNELYRLINENPDVDTEEIEIAIIKIKNRYRDIENIAKKLKTYARRIDNYPDEEYEPNMEDDYGDEMVISKDLFKTQKVAPEENVKVIDHYQASDEIIESLSKVIDFHQASKDFDELISHTEKEDLPDNEPEEKEDNFDSKEYMNEDSEETLDDNYATFTLNNNISLQNLVKHVYEENDDLDYDSELWAGVYNYSDNHEKIDEVASEMDLSVDVIAKTPGLLNGVTLKFPTELIAYDKISTDDVAKKVA